ncbi:MAG: phosphate ABC transporter permease subunit PstC [Deltaproteobacteria bacterium]|nr:phosphate ABC transporter permease subunit PstC [Deltaproteobacteria bacterium]
MWKDKAMRLLMVSAASTSIFLVALIFIFLVKEAAPFVLTPGLRALLDRQWIPVSFVQEHFGILPLVTGSALVTGLSMLFTIPLSVLGAIYIAEIANPVEREILKPFIELLASIPSVVLGFFGLVVLAPLIKALFGLGTGLTALTGAFLLTLMAIPTVITLSEDAIMSVPRAYKDASQALGASDLQTIFRVIIPAALPGIIAAIMLGVGRVIGETMAVLMVTGNSALMSWSPLAPVRTMTATIAAEMGEVSFGSIHYQALFWIGLVLLAVTFILNIIAQRVLVRYGMMK